jgi:hypothetical protein
MMRADNAHIDGVPEPGGDKELAGIKPVEAGLVQGINVADLVGCIGCCEKISILSIAFIGHGWIDRSAHPAP